MATLLALIQEASRRCKIAVPASAVNNTNNLDAQIFYGLANRAGKQLIKRHDWQKLQTEKTFTSVAAALQTSAYATDVERILPATMHNRTEAKPISGPLTPQAWQRLQSLTAIAAYSSFRIRNNDIYVFPTPTAGQTFAYEYISNKWVLAALDTSPTKTAFSADTDTCVFDDELMHLELEWRWKHTHGFDYAELMREAEERAEYLASEDQVLSTLDMGGETVAGIEANIPEGSWVIP